MGETAWVVETGSEKDTEAFGRRLAGGLGPGDVVGLTGELGSGKTCLVRGICEGLGVTDRVTSPTFLTVHEYRGRLPVYHVDLFRFERVEDLREHGYDEILFGRGVTLIEWSEKIAEALFRDGLDIQIEVRGQQERRLTCRPRGPRGRQIVERLELGD